MKTVFRVFSTAFIKDNAFWQFVVIPTVAILRNTDENYYVVSFEWLFWSAAIMINK